MWRRAVACAAAALVALTLAETGRASLIVGVTDDTAMGGSDRRTAFLVAFDDLGLGRNQVTVRWDPTRPTTIRGHALLDLWVGVASARGVRVAFAVLPRRAGDLTASPAAPEQFATFLQGLALRYPGVREIVVGNEPNQPRFWQPQFASSGRPASGAAYQAVLARAYDAIKEADPAIKVLGVGLSPRGNDNPRAPANVSTSPVRFLYALGEAYRASGRTKPLMDGLSFHPYPNKNTDAPTKGYHWPNVGVPNLARLKQAIWDAFDGTAQPTVEDGLTLTVGEIGWQADTARRRNYHGRESVRTVSEQTQARYYATLVERFACDPSIDSLNFFHLVDEADRERWQSGLLRANGTRRPAYAAVKRAIARTGGRCRGTPVRWRHTTAVVGAAVSFGKLKVPRNWRHRLWTFRVTAKEEASYSAAVFRVGGARALQTVDRQLVARMLQLPGGGANRVLSTAGRVKAYWQKPVRFPAKRLHAGAYVYGVRVTAALNPKRASLFVSRPFRVLPPPKTR